MGVGAGTAAGIAAGVGAAGSVGGALISSSAASSAAKSQAGSAKAAQDQAAAEEAATNQRVAPWVATGVNAENMLANMTGVSDAAVAAGVNPLTKPYAEWDPTEAGLEATPGYQFTKDQGLKGVQNSFAAKGLASSGAAMKGAADYVTGLADQTYNQQFQNYLQGKQSYLAQNQQIYNMIGGLAGTGQNAALGVSALNLNSTGQQMQAITAAGAAQAAGTVGSSNALSSGLTGAAGAVSNGLLTNSALNNQNAYGANNVDTPAPSGTQYSNDGTPLGQGYYTSGGVVYD